jgi:hypothetical protein
MSVSPAITNHNMFRAEDNILQNFITPYLSNVCRSPLEYLKFDLQFLIASNNSNYQSGRNTSIRISELIPSVWFQLNKIPVEEKNYTFLKVRKHHQSVQQSFRQSDRRSYTKVRGS